MKIPQIFERHKSTLKETSKDDHDKQNIDYMTESQKEVINFDEVVEEYKQILRLLKTPKSIDALVYTDTKKIFIEFKNGVIENPYNREETKEKISDIKDKILNSVLIFNDITSSQLYENRIFCDFILVYNGQKNSKQKIGSHVLKKGSSGGLIRFNLENLKKYCFRNVYTYTKEEFEKTFLINL